MRRSMRSALLGVLVGATGLATAVSAAPGFDPSIAEEMLIEAGFVRGEDGLFSATPTLVATGEQLGDDAMSNAIVGAEVDLYDFGGVDLSERFFDTPNLDLVDDLDLGDPAWFTGQPGGFLVTFSTVRPPDLVDGRIGEVAIGYNLPGQEVLETSDFGSGDPLLGLGSNLSIASLDGETIVGHAVVSGGRFAQTSNPLPVWTWFTDEGFGGATLLPASATDIEITVSESADGAPTSLVSAFGRPALPSASVVLDGAAEPSPDELLITREEFEAILGLGDEPPSEESLEETVEQTNEQTTEETVEETVEQPVEETVEQPVDETTEQPVEETVEQPVEQTVEETMEQTAGETTEQPVEAPGDAAGESNDGGGGSGWLWLLLGGTGVAIIVAYLIWRQLSGGSSDGADASDQATPTPAEEPGTGRGRFDHARYDDMITSLRLRVELDRGTTWNDDGWLPLSKAAVAATTDDILDDDEAGEFSGLIVNVMTLEYLHREKEQFGAVAATFGLDASTGPFVAPITTVTAMDDHRRLVDLTPDQAREFLTEYLERQLGTSLLLYADRISEAHLGRGGAQLPGGWIAPTFGAAFMNLATDSPYIDEWCGFFINVGDRRVVHDGDPLFGELLDQFGFDGPVERNDAMLSSMIDEVAVL